MRYHDQLDCLGLLAPPIVYDPALPDHALAMWTPTGPRIWHLLPSTPPTPEPDVSSFISDLLRRLIAVSGIPAPFFAHLVPTRTPMHRSFPLAPQDLQLGDTCTFTLPDGTLLHATAERFGTARDAFQLVFTPAFAGSREQARLGDRLLVALGLPITHDTANLLDAAGIEPLMGSWYTTRSLADLTRLADHIHGRLQSLRGVPARPRLAAGDVVAFTLPDGTIHTGTVRVGQPGNTPWSLSTTCPLAEQATIRHAIAMCRPFHPAFVPGYTGSLFHADSADQLQAQITATHEALAAAPPILAIGTSLAIDLGAKRITAGVRENIAGFWLCLDPAASGPGEHPARCAELLGRLPGGRSDVDAILGYNRRGDFPQCADLADLARVVVLLRRHTPIRVLPPAPVPAPAPLPTAIAAPGEVWATRDGRNLVQVARIDPADEQPICGRVIAGPDTIPDEDEDAGGWCAAGAYVSPTERDNLDLLRRVFPLDATIPATPAPAAATSPHPQIGDRWRTRDGSEVEVTAIDRSTYVAEYALGGTVRMSRSRCYATGMQSAWTARGAFYAHIQTHHDLDLVERIAPSAPLPLDVRPGEYRRTRDGKVALIERVEHGVTYPIRGRSDGLLLTWTLSGRHLAACTSAPDDLIERIADIPHRNPAVRRLPQIGETWITRGGRRAVVTARRSGDVYPLIVTARAAFSKDDHRYSVTSTGREFIHTESADDLIERAA